MALNKEARSLIDATTHTEKISTEEYTRVLKESKALSKKLNKEVVKIANKPILKQRLAQLYVSGFYSIKQIASILMISETSVKRLLKDNEILDMVIKYQDEEKQLIDTRIKALRSKATETLDELLDSDDDSLRYQVAKDILDRTGHKEKESKDININVSYEQQLNELIEGIQFVEVEGDSNE
jgi:dTDP-glucose pyrophosphorylase